MKTIKTQKITSLIVIAIIIVLHIIPMASGEQYTWTCPKCERMDNKGNYCGECGHPAPWIEINSTDEIIEEYDIPGFKLTVPEFQKFVTEIFAICKQWNSSNFPYKQYKDFPLIPNIDLTTTQELRQIVSQISGTTDDEFHVNLSLDTYSTFDFEFFSPNRNNSLDYYINRWEDGTYWYGIQYMLSANDETFEYTSISWGFSRDNIIIQITSPELDMMMFFNPNNGEFEKLSIFS